MGYDCGDKLFINAEDGRLVTRTKSGSGGDANSISKKPVTRFKVEVSGSISLMIDFIDRTVFSSNAPLYSQQKGYFFCVK